MLPTYTNIAEQRHRQEGQHRRPYGLIAPKSTLLPWQIFGAGNPEDEAEVLVVSAVDDSTTIVFAGGVEYSSTGSKYWLTYKAEGLDTESQIPCGFWYFAITLGGATRYTEVFEVVEDSVIAQPGYIKLLARHSMDRGGSLFQTGFDQFCYFEGVAQRPTLDRDVQETEDANGKIVVEYGRIEARSGFTIVNVPDYMIYPLGWAALLNEFRAEVNGITHHLIRAQVEVGDYSSDLSTATITYSTDQKIATCEENEVLI